MAKKLISYDDEAEGLGLPDVVEQRLNATYGTKTEVAARLTKSEAESTYAKKGDLPAGAVTSPSVVTIRETYDPNEPASPGELLLLLPETQMFTDFSTATLGAVPDGFVDSWGPPGSWAVTESAAATGGKVLRMTTSGGNPLFALLWEGLGGAKDVEIVFRWRSSSHFRPIYGLVRADHDMNGYWSGQRNSTVQSTGKFVAGVNTRPLGEEVARAQPIGSWSITRVKMEGATLMSRSWTDGDPEPQSWAVTADDTTFTEYGLAGLAVVNAGTVGFWIEVDWIGANVPGHTEAPSA